MKTPPHPYKHQKDFLTWSLNRSQVPLISEQGTGKTWMALAWLERLRLSGPVAILCETGFMDTWLDELRRFTYLQAVTVKGTLSQRCKALMSSKPVKIIGYDSLVSRLLPSLRSIPWEACLADESTNLKRYKAKQTKNAVKIFQATPCKMIITGTPITNSLFDVWSQFLFLDGGRLFGPSFWDFRLKYFRPWGFEWKPKPGTLEKFEGILTKEAFRVLKKDCLDLPNKIKKQISVELHPEAKKAYEGLVKDWLYRFEDGTTVQSKYVIQMMTQLAQICSGWVKETRIPCSKRSVLEALLKNIERDSKGIVIWCRFLKEVTDVVEVCEKLRLSGVTFTGEDSAKEIVKEFQESSAKVFVTTIQKGAKGITLTKASHVIYYGLNFDYELYAQSEDRTHRIGSEIHQRIHYYRLCTKGTVEQSIMESLKNKQNIALRTMPKKSALNLAFPPTD